MPILVAALMWALRSGAFSIVGSVLLSLGFGLATMTGVDASLDWLKGQISSSMGGVTSTVLATMSACQIGSSVSIILSAMSARLVFDGMTNGTIKKWITK